MKILILASLDSSLVNFRGPLIAKLLESGHEIIVNAPHFSAQSRELVEALGAKVASGKLSRTGLNPLQDIEYFLEIRKLISLEKPDLVLTYTAKPNIWGSLAARSKHTQSVSMVTGLGYAFTDQGEWKQRLLKLVLIALYRFSTNSNKLVIFQNPDDKDYFISSKCLADKSKARIVNGSGVDTDYYALTPLPEKPKFLLIARLLKNKGIREYVSAAKMVMDTHPETEFSLAGYLDEGLDGITEQELQSWINSGIKYLGNLDDVRNSIENCSVYVLPSYREGTPRTVLEAMSMGRPIITTDAPGCRETVVENENGYLVPIKNAEAIASKMRLLADNKKLRTDFGKSSRKLAMKKYDVHKVNAQLIEYLFI